MKWLFHITHPGLEWAGIMPYTEIVTVTFREPLYEYERDMKLKAALTEIFENFYQSRVNIEVES